MSVSRQIPKSPFVAAPRDIVRRTAERGQALELEPGFLWQLTEGEVVAYRAGRPTEVWRAPRPLDAASAITGDRSASFVAACDVRLEGRPIDAVPNEEIIRELARENALLWRRIEADARRDDDTFLPWARPVPGPWWFRKATAIVLVMQGEPARLRRSLPRGVHLLPGTGGRYLLALTRFEDVGSLDPRDTSRFAYHEVTPFLPVWSGRRGPAAFIPELYPDAWMAVILGREIHGFPKRTARIGFHEDGADLLVDRRLAARVRYGGEAARDPHAALGELTHRISGSAWLGTRAAALLRRRDGSGGLAFSTLLHKRIGDVRTAGRTLALDDVVRVPVELDPIRGAALLSGLSVEVPGGPGILHGSALAGWKLETGFRFGEGTIERRAKSA